MPKSEDMQRDQRRDIDDARKGLIDIASQPVSKRLSDMFPGSRLSGLDERLRIMRHPHMEVLEPRDVPWLKQDDLALWCALHGRRGGHARMEGLLILALLANPAASLGAVVAACLVSMGYSEPPSRLAEVGRPIEAELLHDAFAEDLSA